MTPIEQIKQWAEENKKHASKSARSPDRKTRMAGAAACDVLEELLSFLTTLAPAGIRAEDVKEPGWYWIRLGDNTLTVSEIEKEDDELFVWSYGQRRALSRGFSACTFYPIAHPPAAREGEGA